MLQDVYLNVVVAVVSISFAYISIYYYKYSERPTVDVVLGIAANVSSLSIIGHFFYALRYSEKPVEQILLDFQAVIILAVVGAGLFNILMLIDKFKLLRKQ